VTTEPALTIVPLSESFESLWTDLAEELDVVCQTIGTDDPVAPEAIALLIAAGGAEEQGLDYLLSHDVSRPPTYLIGSNESHRFGVEAVRRGAADYFALPHDLDLLRRTLAANAEAVRERRSGEQAQIGASFEHMIGESDALKATLAKAARVVGHADVTVLIGGETGTGKEVLARALHEGGPRANEPFVAVNCAAIPSNLLESELFGHEKGAFTDAKQARAGLFEEANRGTLFLDEIGHLPFHLQGKLLRALEDKRIRRVGDTRDREIDTRIIAASHVDLPGAVAQGEFRQDLFYRLNVVTLQLPPLRDRGNDIEVLAKEFAKSLAARYQVPVPEVTPEVLAAIRAHSWPGNVRELQHAIERALLLSPPGTLDPEELALHSTLGPGTSTGGLPFPATLRDINTAAATAAVASCDGNKSAAARQLGISRARLQRLLEHGDDDED
jgi:DNA-binding NtrC family response regulator